MIFVCYFDLICVKIILMGTIFKLHKFRVLILVMLLITTLLIGCLGASENTKKVIKNDRGLIERTKSSKVILTEDNRQILND